MKSFNLAIAFLIFATTAAAQKPISVPQTRITELPVTDGHFKQSEWKGAVVTEISKKDSVYLLLKNYDSHIMLGIRSPFRMLAYIDLFIDYGDGSIHQFHTSAQIGERVLQDTTWTNTEPAAHWGNALDWYANEMRNDKTKAIELLKKDPNRNKDLMLLETTYPMDGYEFIFDKGRFSKKKWKVRIEVKSAMPGIPQVNFPADSKRKNSDTWPVVVFE